MGKISLQFPIFQQKPIAIPLRLPKTMKTFASQIKIRGSKFSAFIIASIFLLQGCRAVYIPNMQNVPTFTEKKEIRATLGVNNYQMAYAATDKIGLMLNGQHIKTQRNGVDLRQSANFEETSKKSLIEGGIGYFKKMEKRGSFEIYGGVGRGNISFDRRDSLTNVGYDRYFAKTSRLFIQPGFGWSVNDFVEIAFSLRVLRLKFFDADISQYDPDDTWFGQDLSLLDKATFAEPALTMRFGGEKVKFHIQGMLSGTQELIDAVPVMMTFGLHLNFVPRQTKQN